MFWSTATEDFLMCKDLRSHVLDLLNWNFKQSVGGQDEFRRSYAGNRRITSSILSSLST